jgi:hypothetical protein
MEDLEWQIFAGTQNNAPDMRPVKTIDWNSGMTSDRSSFLKQKW